MVVVFGVAVKVEEALMFVASIAMRIHLGAGASIG
jgi:hypothetical protein